MNFYEYEIVGVPHNPIVLNFSFYSVVMCGNDSSPSIHFSW